MVDAPNHHAICILDCRADFVIVCGRVGLLELKKKRYYRVLNVCDDCGVGDGTNLLDMYTAKTWRKPGCVVTYDRLVDEIDVCLTDLGNCTEIILWRESQVFALLRVECREVINVELLEIANSLNCEDGRT